MKGAIYQNGKIQISELPEPKIASPTEVKIRIAYCSICGYEMMMYRGIVGSYPAVGHEASGIVVEVGNDVCGISVGDCVTLNPQHSCYTCDACRRGQFNYCTDHAQNPVHFMAEYAVLDYRQVFLLGRQLSLIAGCLIEPLTVCLRAYELANLHTGQSLLIIGGGAMGQILVRIARQNLLGKVVVVDPHKSKRYLARANGAFEALDPYAPDYAMAVLKLTQGNGFDAVIEASGNPSALSLGYNFIARGGSFVILSMYRSDFEFPINLLNLYWKDVSIHAVFPPLNYFPAAVSIAPRLDLEGVITATYSLEQADEAFEAKATGEHCKVVVDLTDHRLHHKKTECL